MSENQNVLEPLVDCILESGILISTTIIKAVSNLSVFLLKTSWDGIESISNALYKKNNHNLYNSNDNPAFINAEYALEDNTMSIVKNFTDTSNTKAIPNENLLPKLDTPQYLSLDSFDNYTLPEKCSYKSLKKDINNTLKCYIGVNIRGVQEIDFFKDGSLLVGGASRWGKTGLLYSILLSLMDRYDSDYLKIVLVDFKQVDLVRLDKYKHVISNCITEITRFRSLLSWIDEECNKRAKLFREYDVANIEEFNNLNTNKLQPVVIVIDEIAQILSGDKKESDEIKAWLYRITCKCMAFGVYFVVCTQELSRDTLGKMKINFTQSIGLKCADKTASDLIIKNGNLEDITVKGRCKIDNSSGITEFQSYLVTINDFKTTLYNKRK